MTAVVLSESVFACMWAWVCNNKQVFVSKIQIPKPANHVPLDSSGSAGAATHDAVNDNGEKK